MKTTPLSLVFIAEQVSLNPVVESLLDNGIAVDKYSTSRWREQYDAHQAPHIVLIDPDTENSRQINTLIEPMELTRCLIIILGELENVSKVSSLIRSERLFHWSTQRESIVDILSQVSTESHTLDEQKRLRDEFLGLNLVGSSPVFLTALENLKKYAQYDAPVLIRGETGTGKEMAARAVHYLGGRRDYPFIPVDCGAIPDNLIENELFGHERGAYTDARQSQRGLVAQAEDGTLFLDEIDALSCKAQVTLLRFLQTHEYRPLGSQQSRLANLRIITATNADLQSMVDGGSFRQDLLFRIDVLSLELPPLRQRLGDTELLAKYFLDNYRHQYNGPKKNIHYDTVAWMRLHQWPGNVRELENFIHREFLLSDDSTIKGHCNNNQHIKERRVSGDRRRCVCAGLSFNEAKANMVEAFEKEYLRQLLQQSQGNVTRAADISGKERRALGRLLKKHGINKDEFSVS